MAKYVTEKFSKDELYKLDVPWGGDCVIEDNIVGTARWSVEHEVVFNHPNGKTYKVGYRAPATESQDEMPWEYDDTVACQEVVEIEKTIKVWEPIKI